MIFKQTMAFLLLAFYLLFSCEVSATILRPSSAPVQHGISPVVAEIGQQLQGLVTGDSTLIIEPQETFGTRALSLILNTAKQVTQEGGKFIDNFAALPKLSKWYDKQVQNPETVTQWFDLGQLLVLVLACAFFVKFLTNLILFPLCHKICKKESRTSLSRFGAALARFALIIVPIILFITAALLVISQTEPTKMTEFMVMTVVYAFALFQLFHAFMRFLLAPRTESLRFLPVSTENAAFLKMWGNLYGGVLIFGTLMSEMATNVKVPSEAISGFRSLVALVVIIMTIMVIVKKRSLVSSFIRGNLSAARSRQSLWESLRLWLARVWHILAIAYLVVGYFVTMIGSEGGFWVMQQGTIGVLLILVSMRLSLFLVSRLAYKKHNNEESSGLYRPVLRFLFRILIWTFGAAGVLAVWGFDVASLVASSWGQRILGSAFSITATILILVALYEILHLFIERKLHRRDSEGNIIEADARSRTLLPMARNGSIFVLVLIATLVTLSEIGVDTGPLLAGAGVFGIAIGFGSQTLVKDFLTGLFILIEDTMAVGDVVRLGDHAGVIEGMTIRTVKLRDMQGALHVLPFGEISQIVNMTKGFAYAVIDMEVDYSSDLDKVMRVIKRVGDELYEDPEFKEFIIEPIDVLGVQEFGNSSITIRSRIKTVGGQQWSIRRAFYSRIKPAFDAENIEIPFPHVVYVNRGEGAAQDPKQEFIQEPVQEA